MPNIFKHLTRNLVQPYQFPEAAEIVLPEDEPEAVESQDQSEEVPAPSEVKEEPKKQEPTPVDYAQLQAEAILQDAHQQAREIMDLSKALAEKESAEIREEARKQGFQEGFDQGMSRALTEGAAKLREEAEAQGAVVQQFLEKATKALDQQLDDNVDELRDLALAVAEKVVCVSLKSSAEVVGRMIQTAIDKRKRCEWVRIYLAECDTKRMTSIPPALSAALSGLSDRVRIIPMADDESGACIIEMPNEIIDASASTQINNIRALLSEAPGGGSETGFLF